MKTIIWTVCIIIEIGLFYLGAYIMHFLSWKARSGELEGFYEWWGAPTAFLIYMALILIGFGIAAVAAYMAKDD